MDIRKQNTTKIVATSLFCAIFLAALSIPAFAAELAPEDLPSNSLITEPASDKVETGDPAADLFPLVEVENPTKPSAEINEALFSQRFIGEDIVTINEPISHDVYVVANELTVEAPLGNDLFAAARYVTLENDVDGSVRVAAETVTIKGIVKKNVLIFANRVRIEDNAVIMGDVFIAASTVTIHGTVEGTAEVYAQSVNLNGILRGQTKAEGQSITVGDDAVFEAATALGSTDYTVSEKASGLTLVQHGTTLTTVAVNDQRKNRSSELGEWLVAFFFFGILGVLMIQLWPKWTKGVATLMEKESARTWERGALFLFLVPVVLLLIAATLIGAPVAFAGFLLYFLVLTVGHIFVGMILGRHLIHNKRFKSEKKQRMAEFVAGYFVLSVLYSLPFFGWIVCILAAVWGVGGMKHYWLSNRKKKKKK